MGAENLEVVTVGVIEGGQLVAIDIKYAAYLTIGDEGYYNFGTRTSATSYVSGKLFYVGYYLGSSLGPSGATHTTASTDAIACHIALERTQDELLVAYKIKAYPKPSEGLAQGGRSVG